MEEHLLTGNPELRGALILSTPGRQPALLIEPAISRSTITQQAQLIEKIWPTIAETNSTSPSDARIDKALILITPPSRPLLRNTNGTINHAANAQQYAAELDTLYTNADLGPVGASSSAPPDRATIAQLVQECVSAVTSWPHEDGDVDHEHEQRTFFERGMDSVVALQLVRVLRRGLWCPWVVGLSTVYCNPTVSRLTEAVFVALEGETREENGERE